jgi:hypothetical protein
MSTKTLIPVLLLASARLCQVPVPPQAAAQKQLDGEQRLLSGQLATMTPRFERVLLDHEPDGTIWAVANDWKASFAPATTTFLPFLGADAERHYPVAFRLVAATVAGTPLALDAAAKPVAAPDQSEVRYERGGLTEVYALALEGIEQKFGFASLPGRGELRLALQVTTDLAGEQRADGTLSFTNSRGGVRYGRAVAIDAAGQRCEVTTRWSAVDLELSVPAAFVAKAQLPLWVDPLVSTIQSAWTDSATLRAIDTAYDGSLDHYAVVWERRLTAWDSDCYLLRYDGAMNYLGGLSALITIDSSLDCWQDCRIANLNAYDKFLVVAECSYYGSSPFWIGGRSYHDSFWPVLGPKLDIARAGVAGHPNGDKLNPDVGGDPETATPTYFTVVWENVANQNQHDILFKQITDQGTSTTPGAIVLDNAGYFCSEPRISKSDGLRPFASQRWAVVWRRCTGGGVCLGMEIRAGMIRWDGQVSFFGAPLQTNFWLTNEASFAHQYSVSSPTDERAGRRRYAFVTDWWDAGTASTDIHGLVFDDTGLRLDIERNLTLLEPWSFHHTRNQYDPVVDCDGTRFAVAYTEAFSATDNDVYVSTFAFDQNPWPQWFAHDPLNVAALSVANEQEAAIVATRSGGGAGVRYGLAWRVVGGGSTNHAVEVRSYDGMQAGSTLVTRTTGCGGLQIAAIGLTALGQALRFTLPNASGALRGFLAGAPVLWPIAGCPGCIQGSDGYIVLGAVLDLAVPPVPGLVGATFAVQGFDFASGPCLGQFRVSDTVDFTLR